MTGFLLVISYVASFIAISIIERSFQGHMQFYSMPIWELTLTLWVLLMLIVYVRPVCRIAVEWGLGSDRRGDE